MPTFGSLFAGIGGIDLGLERAGWRCRWQVESDPFCQIVLGGHWPLVPRYGDVHDVDWSQVEPVDMIAGGFPCQPVSKAGKQKGVGDDRWLWPEFARAVRVLRPSVVFVENVPGLLAERGGMGVVVADLAAIGYMGEWGCIAASAVGAPHVRDRVWIIATPAGSGTDVARAGIGTPDPVADADGPGSAHGGEGDPGEGVEGPGAGTARAAGCHRGRARNVADPDGPSVRGRPGSVADPARAPESAPDQRERVWADHGAGRPAAGDPEPAGRIPHPFGTRLQRAVGSILAEPGYWRSDADLARPDRWGAEPDVGRMANGVPGRVDRLRALGNAVVPQVAEMIGRRLIEADQVP